MPIGRKKKEQTCFSKVTNGIGMVFLITLGLPVVLVGGIVQLGGAALSYGFRSFDGGSNGKKQEFKPMRKGVRIHPM